MARGHAPAAAVTLDVTGTLIHSPRRGEIYSEVLGRHGLPVGPERADELITKVWEELDCSSRMDLDRFRDEPGGAKAWWRRFVDRLAEHLGSEPPSPFAAAELFDRFAHADSWQLYPEVEEVLDRLASRKLRLGIISNWDERLPAVLEGLGLLEYFETVTYSAIVGVEKPHSAIFGRALSDLKLPPARVLHVGDSRRRDVEGAEAVGMPAFLLDRHGGDGDLASLTDLPRRAPVASVVEGSDE